MIGKRKRNLHINAVRDVTKENIYVKLLYKDIENMGIEILQDKDCSLNSIKD